MTLAHFMPTAATRPDTMLSHEDVARLSDETGKLYELVDGELAEKARSTRANDVAAEVVVLLRSTYPRIRAHVFVEQPTYCFDTPQQMRRPDVALVWAERMPGGPDDSELLIAPDLAVEVVSPTNLYTGLLHRVEEYLAAGVPIVWLIEPERRWIHVYRQDGSLSLFRPGDHFQDEPLLPGLRFLVDELIPAWPAPAAPGSQGPR